MKKKKYLKTLLVMPIILIGLILISSNDEKYKENAIAIFIEDNDGEYKLSSDTDFPTNGYILDTDKSFCKNGGTLSQDNDTKELSLSTQTADECNVYFKIGERPSLVDIKFSLQGDYIYLDSIRLDNDEEAAHVYVRPLGAEDFSEVRENGYIFCAPTSSTQAEIYVINTYGIASPTYLIEVPYIENGGTCIEDPYVPLE